MTDKSIHLAIIIHSCHLKIPGRFMVIRSKSSTLFFFFSTDAGLMGPLWASVDSWQPLILILLLGNDDFYWSNSTLNDVLGELGEVRWFLTNLTDLRLMEMAWLCLVEKECGCSIVLELLHIGALTLFDRFIFLRLLFGDPTPMLSCRSEVSSSDISGIISFFYLISGCL